MTIILAILLVISSCLLIFLTNKLKQKQLLDEQTEQRNKELLQTNAGLLKDNEYLQDKNKYLQDVKIDLDKDLAVVDSLIDEKQKRYDELVKTIDERQSQLEQIINQNKEISGTAFQEYWNMLDTQYARVEDDYDKKVELLNHDIDELCNELQKLKSTRAAAHQAMLKEKEVKENKDNYRLLPSASDLADARRLELVKKELNKPRILSMLVWQTYWQPLAKKQFPIILKDKTKCGIYKITNLLTDECYIGQAVDVYTRWNQHCKCGLGIDTPVGNKLYKAMQEYGLDNFTFELVEECSQEELNEKERYFISLYQADIYGYNSINAPATRR